jgi:hypothetical protein
MSLIFREGTQSSPNIGIQIVPSHQKNVIILTVN